MSDSSPEPEQNEASRSPSAPRLWDDRVLWIAFFAAGLLLVYQLAVTLLQPTWIGPATDWLQMLVAWAALLATVLFSRWFTRHSQLVARSWWWVSAGLLSYALARTVWLVEDQFITSHRVLQPSWHDLFVFLQYPCYLLALLLVPRVRPMIQRALQVLDGCLLLGAAFALSWYFLLAPIYLDSQETLLGKLVHLSYPVGDLAIFFGLTMIWLHYREYALERAVLGLLIVAIACLVVADTWFALYLLHASSYQSGSSPDLFWLAFYLLLPLAGLVRLRLTQRALASGYAGPLSQQAQNLRRHDLFAGLRVTAPVAGAWLAGAVLIIRGELVASVIHPVAPPLIALALLALALARQGLTAVDNERLRREREAALHETTAQMETFLGIASHELKNPLASMQLCLQVVEQRIRRRFERERGEVRDVAHLLDPVAQAQRQQERLDRLINDLVDVARIRAGRLDLHLTPTDLAPIVREVVEEQQQINPERIVRLECPEEQHAPVLADPYRLGQVVTN